MRHDNEKPFRAYVASVMDNSLFSGKDQRSYYFLPDSAESISLLRRSVLALQLDINIHTIIRWNDDDDCYCYFQYYYCCCSLFVFWGAVDLLIYFNRSDILCILHGFVHVFKVGFAHPAINFLCETSAQHLLACSRRSVRIVERGTREKSAKKKKVKRGWFFSLLRFLCAVPTIRTPGTGYWTLVLLPSGDTWYGVNWWVLGFNVRA